MVLEVVTNEHSNEPGWAVQLTRSPREMTLEASIHGATKSLNDDDSLRMCVEVLPGPTLVRLIEDRRKI